MMRLWGHEGGFSLNAEVMVAARDRAGLERLLRYCARPIFASERLQWIEKDQRLVYCLPKPRPDGQTVLYLTPLKFLDKLAVLIPPPRKHRHRYHGVLAPNAPLRQAVTSYARLPRVDEAVSADQAPVADEDRSEAGFKATFTAASVWAMLIARIYKVFPLVCPQCGGELKIVAFLTEVDPIQRIMIHIGELATQPRIAPARAPPDWFETDFDQTDRIEAEQAEPVPEFEFDQTVNWLHHGTKASQSDGQRFPCEHLSGYRLKTHRFRARTPQKSSLRPQIPRKQSKSLVKQSSLRCRLPEDRFESGVEIPIHKMLHNHSKRSLFTPAVAF